MAKHRKDPFDVWLALIRVFVFEPAADIVRTLARLFRREQSRSLRRPQRPQRPSGAPPQRGPPRPHYAPAAAGSDAFTWRGGFG